MTPEEQNIAIAKWIHPDASDAWIEGFLDGQNDFANDLNAMHEAEYKLNQEQQESFVHTLVGIIVNPCEVEYGPLNLTQSDVLWMVSFSTSAQRAEALLRSIGKWEEKK